MEKDSLEKGEIEDEVKNATEPQTVENGSVKGVNPLRMARPLEKGITATKGGSNKNGTVSSNENNATAKDPLDVSNNENNATDSPPIETAKTIALKKDGKKSTSKPVTKKSPVENKPTDNIAKKNIPNENSKKVEESKSIENNANDSSARGKRSRAPRNVYEAPDPEMDQILKSIKKMESDGDGSTNTDGAEETQEVAVPEKRVVDKKVAKAATDSSKKKTRKISISDEDEDEEKDDDDEEDEENEDDEDDYKPVPTKKNKRKKLEDDEDDYEPDKPAKKKKKKPTGAKKTKTTLKKEPIFFKDEHLAVRTEEGGFYICKAKQNIFIGSKSINIQWWSNEDDVIPAKDNPEKNIYAADFYDKTDFETILTSVELSKRGEKGKKGLILPASELERINKILNRAEQKAAGTLNMDNMDLTEDNPDGLDISLYKGEEQLDEIDKRRKGTDSKEKKKVVSEKVPEEKIEIANNQETVAKSKDKPKVNVPKKRQSGMKLENSEDTKDKAGSNEAVVSEVSDKLAKSDPAKIEEDESIKVKKEAKAPKIKAKEEKTVETPKTDEGNKRMRRTTSKPITYNQYDFLEDEEDEVMPSKKKRAKEDEATNSTAETEVKETPDTNANNISAKKKEILSTSERALIAEKEKINTANENPNNEEEKESDIDPLNEGDISKTQPVKKRGRKPKPKE